MVRISSEKSQPEQDAEESTGFNNYSVEASPSDEILLEEMRRRHDLQWQESELLNTKTGVVLAYLGALGVAMLALGPDFAADWRQQILVVQVTSAVSFALYISAIVSCVLTLRTRRFYAPIGVGRTEVEAYLGRGRSDMVLQILSQYSHYILRNIPELKKRNRWFLCSVAQAAVLTVLLSLSAFITHFFH